MERKTLILIVFIVLSLVAIYSLFTNKDPEGFEGFIGKSDIPISVQRQTLTNLNNAIQPLDLAQKYPGLISTEMAIGILSVRDNIGPFGFRDLADLQLLPPDLSEVVFRSMNPNLVGRWTLLPYQTRLPPHRRLFPTGHAAMLRTGKVLFLPNGETTQTLIWDPRNETKPTFSLPEQPTTDRLFCSGHAFLPDGQLLVVGGGGGSPGSAINSAWRFDPSLEKWSRIQNMSYARWYPTAVTLGDGRVLVASGLKQNKTEATQMEIFDPASNTFDIVRRGPVGSGTAVRPFPETYPSLHLTPNGNVLYSRTGWGRLGTDDGTKTASVFEFTGNYAGNWRELESTHPKHPDRSEGMAVLSFDEQSNASIIVIAGGSPSHTARDSIEILDIRDNEIAWRPHPVYLPKERVNVNAVLLPNGEILISGGVADPDISSLLFNPNTSSWREVAPTNYVRQYHSTALLLPSGKVITTGGDDGNSDRQRTSIEIFSPPYLFGDLPRPTILHVDDVATHGESFSISTKQAKEIDEVVLMRPMAITHHTDSEQRRIELSFELTSEFEITANTPSQTNIAPPGYYMLFLLAKGKPSEARFVHVKSQAN